MVLWWFTHIRSALFHERGHLSGTMITGILEQFLHLKASLSQSLDSFVVTKHCLFSRSSPLNFLCSTGSKWLFSHLCKSLLLVNKSRLCLSVVAKAEMLCAVQVFTVLLLCVLCEWQQVRCTEKPPDKSRLHSALRWLTDSYTHWMYCRTVFKTHRII